MVCLYLNELERTDAYHIFLKEQHSSSNSVGFKIIMAMQWLRVTVVVYKLQPRPTRNFVSSFPAVILRPSQMVRPAADSDIVSTLFAISLLRSTIVGAGLITQAWGHCSTPPKAVISERSVNAIMEIQQNSRVISHIRVEYYNNGIKMGVNVFGISTAWYPRTNPFRWLRPWHICNY